MTEKTLPSVILMRSLDLHHYTGGERSEYGEVLRPD